MSKRSEMRNHLKKLVGHAWTASGLAAEMGWVKLASKVPEKVIHKCRSKTARRVAHSLGAVCSKVGDHWQIRF
jgi:hypothetical protein